jgi:hypothetical protein
LPLIVKTPFLSDQLTFFPHLPEVAVPAADALIFVLSENVFSGSIAVEPNIIAAAKHKLRILLLFIQHTSQLLK